MNDFIILMLTKLGLGVGASETNIGKLEKDLHSIFGNDFSTRIIESYMIEICYNNTIITLEYTIKNKVVKKLTIK